MKNFTIQFLIASLFSINCFATANFVYHERTMNTTGAACGPYVSNLNPTYLQTSSIEFTIDYQYFTNRAVVYYTTDGTNPSGAFGVTSGTTQLINASYYCAFNNGSGMIDVARATFPMLPFGTNVKYIVSAWHTGGGLEIFGSSGTNTTSASATIFSYIVTAPLQVTMTSFFGSKLNNEVKLSWTTAQEMNVDHYEIYRSADGIQFDKISSKNSLNNPSLTTYTQNDLSPLNGVNFYKIKSVDKDGKYNFTQVIKIIFSEKKISSVYQNGTWLQISFSGADRENYTFRLINNAGQILKTETFLPATANEVHEILLPPSAKGVYHVSINSANTIFTQSLFIQ